MKRRLAVIGALATLTSGCSMVLVDGPPGYIPANDPVPVGACTTERIIPLVDAVGAVAGVATALTNSDGNAVRFGAVAGGALGFSSYTGFRRVGACRKRVSPASQGAGLASPASTFLGVPPLLAPPEPGVLPGELAVPRLLQPFPATPRLRPDPAFLTVPWPRVSPPAAPPRRSDPGGGR